MKGDEVDDLIDRGLRDYVAKEPEAGMEARVLRRIHRRDSRFRIALAVAAGFVFGIFAARVWQKPLETLAMRPVSARIEVPTLTRVRVVSYKHGMTAGERALLRFVQDHPEQALEAFAKRDDFITVDPIDIPPLAIEPLETKEENKK